MSNKKYIELKVVGNEPELTEFVRLCQQIQYLGYVGSSRTIRLHVDGDGSGHLKFTVNGEEIKHPGISEDVDLYIGE